MSFGSTAVIHAANVTASDVRYATSVTASGVCNATKTLFSEVSHTTNVTAVDVIDLSRVASRATDFTRGQPHCQRRSFWCLRLFCLFFLSHQPRYQPHPAVLDVSHTSDYQHRSVILTRFLHSTLTVNGQCFRQVGWCHRVKGLFLLHFFFFFFLAFFF